MSQTRNIPRLVQVDAHSVDQAIIDLIRHRMGLENSATDGVQSEWVRTTGALREILNHHVGPPTPRAIVQIWSNILFATGFDRALHVFGGNNAPGFWNLARIHFGCSMPMTNHVSPAGVVQACAADAHAIGVLPLPESEEDVQGWWEQLAPPGSSGPRVVQRLPFVREDGCLAPLPGGFAIASVEQEATAGDTTLLRMEHHGELSRARLHSCLREAGFDAHVVSASRAGSGGIPTRILIAARGRVTIDDERLSGIAALAGGAIGNVSLVGGYAHPFDGASTSQE